MMTSAVLARPKPGSGDRSPFLSGHQLAAAWRPGVARDGLALTATTSTGVTMGPRWAGSTRAARLPGDWKSRVARVKARADGQCEWVDAAGRCARDGTDCDHIVRGDDHSLENLQWLCREHHEVKTKSETLEARRAKRPARPARRHPGLRPTGHDGGRTTRATGQPGRATRQAPDHRPR